MKNKPILILFIAMIIITSVIMMFKFFWWLFIIIGVLAVIVIGMLVFSKKVPKENDDDLESKIRNTLSSIRRQKFKSEAKINRLKEWANDAIYTTYGDLFSGTKEKSELYVNYSQIKEEYSGKLNASQIEKTDNIVDGYLRHIEIEKNKIQTLDKLQTEHEELKTKIKQIHIEQRKNERLDKHSGRISANSEDLSGEKVIAKASFNVDDLRRDVDLKHEYIKQLDELSLEYGENSDSPQIGVYERKLKDISDKI